VKEMVESVFFVMAVVVFIVILPLMWLRKLRTWRNKKLAVEHAAADERY
jgi:hypothetical protein